MGRFLLTRLGLAAITLFLLSVLVFVGREPASRQRRPAQARKHSPTSPRSTS